jgi:membrane protein
VQQQTLSRNGTRPVPDEAELDDLNVRDWLGIFKRAGKLTLEHNLPLFAQALAYSTFLAIPSVLLVAVGLFTLLAGPQTIDNLIARLHTVVPHQATQLLSGSLHRLDQRPSSSLAITIVGVVLALWSTTSAMNAYMVGINIAYGHNDRRSFVKKRLVALVMVACIGAAFLLVAALLIFGPSIEHWVGNAIGASSFLGWVWWVAEWPVLLVGLAAAFATLLYLGPDEDDLRWRFLTPGTVVAVLIWLATSGAFAFYTSSFSSYNKTWGSLAAVIVMLTWLWLTALALLFGAELNAEVERSARGR